LSGSYSLDLEGAERAPEGKRVDKNAEQITGEDLARIGFRVEQSGPILRTSTWYVKGAVRVVQQAENGLYIYGFADSRRLILDWEAQFTAGTPASLVMSTLLKAVGG
jgi:hypothetical protein